MSVNERLRTAMMRNEVDVEDLAAHAGVDPKTATRWVTTGRLPHRRHRWAVAAALGCEESWLFPDAAPRRELASESELIRMYPDRASIPRETWLRLMDSAHDHLDVLVFSGTFYAQTQPRIASMLTDAAERGVQVRLCFGDPDSEAVAVRDREEGLAGTLAAKIRSSLLYYRALAISGQCEVRLHGCTLYASLFRYDDDIIVNPHVWGDPGSANPCLYLRRLDGGQVAGNYIGSFERVWGTAKPWHGDEV